MWLWEEQLGLTRRFSFPPLFSSMLSEWESCFNACLYL